MWWLIIPAALAVFIAVIILRAVNFKPKAQPALIENEEKFDGGGAVESLRALVRFKTVSYRDPSLEDNAEFDAFIAALPDIYPSVFAKCKFTRMEDRGLLFKWKGKGSGQPAVMMAHYDVVPVNEAGWDVPAFEALLKDGRIWGRGTLDTKVTFNGIMFAAEHLIKEGYEPENDIYFAFSGNEEINGKGAVNIVDYFENEGIEPAFVIDEKSEAKRS